LIVYGAVATLDEATPVGVALAVQARDRRAVGTLLKEGRAGLSVFPCAEVHDWEFGGRRRPAEARPRIEPAADCAAERR
jgi:hypothetical protein